MKNDSPARPAEVDHTAPMKTALRPGALVLDGRFRVKSLLGSGGMGEVYVAEQLSLGRQVAIKALRAAVSPDAKASERFGREARLLSAVDHPNVIRVIDFAMNADGAFLVMELVDGSTLEELARGGPMEPTRAGTLLLQVAEGLSAIHARDILHRDLKPENVLVATRGSLEEARLLDFGLARLTEAEEGTESLTQAGLVLGTPTYLSPEQAGGGALSPRTDLYSFGVMAYRLLAGRLPFVGPSPRDYLLQHLTAQPRPLLEVAPHLKNRPALVALVTACLEKEPEKRPESAGSVAQELRRILREENPTVHAEPSRSVSPSTPVGASTRAEPNRSTGATIQGSGPSGAGPALGGVPRNFTPADDVDLDAGPDPKVLLSQAAEQVRRHIVPTATKLGETVRKALAEEQREKTKTKLKTWTTAAWADRRIRTLAAVAVIAVVALIAAQLARRFTTSGQLEQLIAEGELAQAMKTIDELAGGKPLGAELAGYRAAALHGLKRHRDEAAAVLKLSNAELEEVPALTIAGLVEDFARDERDRELNKLLGLIAASRIEDAYDDAAEKSAQRWGAIRAADLLHSGKGLDVGDGYIEFLTHPECELRSISARRLGELGERSARGELEALVATPKKRTLFIDVNCGQDEAKAALQAFDAK